MDTLCPAQNKQEATARGYSQQEKLRDGRVLKIRAIVPQDKKVLAEGMHHLSPTSLYYRFLTPKKELTEQELVYFTEVDFLHHVALLAEIEDDGQFVPAGIGRYVMSDSRNSSTAELAFAICEEYQGLGIATLLLHHLTLIAKSNGLKTFTALVLPENRKMLEVFRNSGLEMKSILNSAAVLELRLNIDPSVDT